MSEVKQGPLDHQRYAWERQPKARPTPRPAYRGQEIEIKFDIHNMIVRGHYIPGEPMSSDSEGQSEDFEIDAVLVGKDRYDIADLLSPTMLDCIKVEVLKQWGAQ